MALFGKKKTEDKKDEAKKPAAKSLAKEPAQKAAAPVVVSSGGAELSGVLIRPHVTEKATMLAERNVYAFDIHSDANKTTVAAAVEAYYKVRPVKIAIIRGARKVGTNPRTNRTMVKRRSVKRALVTLKKGDKIEFV